MEANELRIGNLLITYATALPQYLRVTPWHMKYFGENGFRDESPIPLTPEILEAAGFLRNDNTQWGGDKWQKRSGRKVFNLYNTDNGFRYLDNQGNTRFVPMLSLHQLQNLYFALTGTELEIKNLVVA
jgi:hypothetical protein